MENLSTTYLPNGRGDWGAMAWANSLERGLGGWARLVEGARIQGGRDEDMDGKKLAKKAKAGAVSPSGGRLARLKGSGCSEEGVGREHPMWGCWGEVMSLPQSLHALYSCLFLFPCCQYTSVRLIAYIGVTSLSSLNAIPLCGCKDPVEKNTWTCNERML